MTSPLPGLPRISLGAPARSRPRWLAIALDEIPADEDEAALIRGAQVHAIVRLTPLVMAASCLNGAILIATFAAMGALRPVHWIWAAALFAMAFNYLRGWRTRTRGGRRAASRRTIRRVILNGALFGAIWAFVPAADFAGGSFPVQLFVACLTAGMMSAGAFVLATVPLAAMSYVTLIAAGALFALLQHASPATLGIMALLGSYAAVIIVNINWSAALFVDSRLAEAMVRREVAAREEAQAQAAHAERMTALGELAGGIAHDVNNILQVVSGGAARIERRADEAEEVLRQARRIQDAVERGSTISRRLLAFARRDALRAEAIDAAALLTELGELLAPAVGPAIRVRVDAARAAGRLLADRSQLETVLLNLATNARDAMPDGGELTISAASTVLAHDSEALRPGRYVRIAVADTGTGIAPDTLPRVAEPFFTTKPKGSGTGLGLSMAKTFVEQSGGALAISSEPGLGTMVSLWLPQAEAGLAEPAGRPPREPGPRGPVGAGRRVLVVDDDALIREGLMGSLQDAGFVALGAENAERALAQLDAGHDIDALVTDFSMPGMSGVELIHEVHARRPRLPTILLTGHLSDQASEAFHRFRAEPFALLYKPMPPARVAQRLAEIMAEYAA
jgi:signal transduction histidine kinase/CheY-like chemotaxis protein